MDPQHQNLDQQLGIIRNQTAGFVDNSAPLTLSRLTYPEVLFKDEYKISFDLYNDYLSNNDEMDSLINPCWIPGSKACPVDCSHARLIAFMYSALVDSFKPRASFVRGILSDGFVINLPPSVY